MMLAEECSRIGAGRYEPRPPLEDGKQQPEQLSARIASGAATAARKVTRMTMPQMTKSCISASQGAERLLRGK